MHRTRGHCSKDRPHRPLPRGGFWLAACMACTSFCFAVPATRAQPPAGTSPPSARDRGTVDGSDTSLFADGASAEADAGVDGVDGASAGDAPFPAGTSIPPRLVSAAPLRLGASAPIADAELLLSLSLDRQGEVVAIAFAEPRHEPLRGPVEDLLRTHFRFEPAQVAGQPVSSRVQLRVEIEREAPAAPAMAQAQRPATGASAAPPPLTSADSAAQAPVEGPKYGARAQVDKPQPGAASQVKLRGAELTHIPGTFGEPLRVVGSLPGVARSPLGLGFYVVRGASFQNSGFFVDGFAVPILYHLGAGPAVIPSRLVKQLDFYAGGYPLAFGRYTAGVIALSTRSPDVDHWQLEFEVDLLRASALFVAPLPDQRGSITLAFRRSYYELILPLITDDVTLSYSDYQVHADYRIAPNLRASLFFFGSRDFLDFELGTGAGSTTGVSASGLRYAFDQLRIGLTWTPSPRLRADWSAIVGPTSLEAGSSSTGSSSVAADTEGMRVGQRLALRFAPDSALVTTLGLDQNTFRYTVSGQAPSVREFPGIPEPAPPTRTVTLEDTLWELGLAPYFEQVLRPGPVVLSWGVRGEYLRYGAVQSWTFDPRVVLRLRLQEGLSLKAATGLFTQPPLPFQISADAANPDLKPNRALQNSLGVEWQLPWSVELDSSLFYNRMWNLTRNSARATVAADGSIEQRFFAGDGQGHAYGLEVLVRRQLQKQLFGWLSYTLSRSERYLEGGKHSLFFYDQTHVMNLALSYAFSGFRFGLKFTLSSGRPAVDRLDPTGARTVYDVDAHDFDVELGGGRIRLPVFHQLDVRIDRDFTLGPLTGSVYLDVLNVYNAQNSEGYQYSFDNRLRGRVPGMPFLPTIGVRGVLR